MANDESETVEQDDDPPRIATYLRGYRNGLLAAARLCDENAKRIRENAPKSPFVLPHGYDAMVILEAAKAIVVIGDVNDAE